MTGFGEKLRREREMRGVSLEEISESTKIGSRSLRALEEDDFDKLPGGIFNKGFVRAYSRFLGLDEEQTVADFEAALKAYRLANNYVEELPVQEEPEPESFRAGWLVVSVLVFVAVAAVAGYFLRARRTAQAPEPQPNVQASPASSQNHPSSARPDAAPSSSASSTIAAAAPSRAETPLASPTPAKSAPPTSIVQNSGANANDGATSTDARATNSNSPIRLNVFAREESWLSISADGRDLGQQILAAQKSRTIVAQKEVRLKVGNLGGVEVSFNGKPVNIDGEPKQVKELTFTPDGLHQ